MEDFRRHLKYVPGTQNHHENKRFRTRKFERINVGKYTISIQASGTHYSTPRDVLDPYEYKAFEVAVFMDGEWVNPRTDKKLSGFAWISHFETGDIVVAGFVPVKTVQEMCDCLEVI